MNTHGLVLWGHQSLILEQFLFVDTKGLVQTRELFHFGLNRSLIFHQSAIFLGSGHILFKGKVMSVSTLSNSNSSKSNQKKFYDTGNDKGNDPFNDAKSESDGDVANKKNRQNYDLSRKKALIFQIGIMRKRHISEPFQTVLKKAKSNMTSLLRANGRSLIVTINRRPTII